MTFYVCRRLLSSSTFLQLITWILLIITKLAIYVISFINFPGLFFVPVLIQFFVTLLVLTFTKVSPSFHASAWHDRYVTVKIISCLNFSFKNDTLYGLLCSPTGSVWWPAVAASRCQHGQVSLSKELTKKHVTFIELIWSNYLLF